MTDQPIAWGAKVSPGFRQKVREICATRGMQPDDLMTCMAFESGRTFRPDIRNGAGSGAVGLIQFMPSTLGAWGLTVEKAARMTAVQQLDLVDRYFKPWSGKLHNLGDVYLAILWPGGVGKSDDYVLFSAGGSRPKIYLQNKGLDADHNESITRGETIKKIRAMLGEGLLPENAA